MDSKAVFRATMSTDNGANVSIEELLIALVNDSCSTPLCPHLTSGTWYLIQAVVLLLSSCLAVPLNIVVVDSLRKSTCVHPNVKLLLINAGVANLLLSLHYVGQSIYNFALYAKIYDQQSRWPVVTQFDCACYQILNGTAIHVLLFTMTGMVAERFSALTLCKASLSVDAESSDKKVRFYAIFCWIAGAAFVLAAFFRWPAASGACICYCHSTLVSSATIFYVSLAIALLAEFANIVLCIVVKKLSVSILATAHSRSRTKALKSKASLNSLTERYQLNRNVKTMSMLYPSLISHSIFYLLALFLRIPVHNWLSFEELLTIMGGDTANGKSSAIHILLMNMQSVSVVCCLHPLLIARNNVALAKSLSERWPKLARLLFAINGQSIAAKAAAVAAKASNKGPIAKRTVAGVGQNPTPPQKDGRNGNLQRKEVAWADKSSKPVKASQAVAFNDEKVWENFW